MPSRSPRERGGRGGTGRGRLRGWCFPGEAAGIAPLPARLGLATARLACLGGQGRGLLPACSALLRPRVVVCAQFWAPPYKKSNEQLERVQWRLTKMMQERLRALGLCREN